MILTKLAPACAWSLIGVLALSLESEAQSPVALIEPSSSPYVQLYSPCRENAPDDPLAQDYFQMLQNSGDFAQFQGLLARLSQKPIASLTPVEGELYFALLSRMDFELSLYPQEDPRSGRAAIADARENGVRIASFFRDDSFVRCAWLASELALSSRSWHHVRFSERKHDAAKREYLAFLESALSGHVRTEMPMYLLHYSVGQHYLDEGFANLPNTERAASFFESGARHLVDAAASATDGRYVDNWQRYAFMLNKLPLRQQRAISLRLLTYVESPHTEDLKSSAAALTTYLHLLNVAGSIAFTSEDGEGAVSIYQRYLRTAQQLRQQDPDNPNYEVEEALGDMLLGDAHALLGSRPAAAEAYRAAERLLGSASPDAREMLTFQGFPDNLKTRIDAVP